MRPADQPDIASHAVRGGDPQLGISVLKFKFHRVLDGPELITRWTADGVDNFEVTDIRYAGVHYSRDSIIRNPRKKSMIQL